MRGRKAFNIVRAAFLGLRDASILFLKVGKTVGEVIFISALAISIGVIVLIAVIISIIGVILCKISKKMCRYFVDREYVEEMSMTTSLNVSTNKIGRKLFLTLVFANFEWLLNILSILRPPSKEDPLEKHLLSDDYDFDSYSSQSPIRLSRATTDASCCFERIMESHEKIKTIATCSSAGILFVISILFLAEYHDMISIPAGSRLVMIILLGIASATFVVIDKPPIKITLILLITPLLLLLDHLFVLATYTRHYATLLDAIMLVLSLLIILVFVFYKILVRFKHKRHKPISSVQGS